MIQLCKTTLLSYFSIFIEFKVKRINFLSI